MNKNVLLVLLLIITVFFVGNAVVSLATKHPMTTPSPTSLLSPTPIDDPLYPKFQLLSTQGNSSCSQDFRSSITAMPDAQRLQGSCCGPIIFHRYKEQVEGLKKYSTISQIPTDPYDIPASLAKELLKYDQDITLTSAEQKKYDQAMNTSEEKGPCCCRCWRWYVYEGLGKYLIRNHQFTGEQVTDIWNLSDGCGGDRHVPGAHG